MNKLQCYSKKSINYLLLILDINNYICCDFIQITIFKRTYLLNHVNK